LIPFCDSFGALLFSYFSGNVSLGNVAGRLQKLSTSSPVIVIELYAIGGSLAIFAMAHISLVDVRDQNSFVTTDVAQNVVFPTYSNSTGFSPQQFYLYVSHALLKKPSPESRFVMNAIGGSLYISSRLSISFSNVNIEFCSVLAKYGGSSASSLSAIGGAVALLSSSNPFAKPLRSWFPEPSRFSIRNSSFNGNKAVCVRNPAFNSNNTVLTAMGGAVALLHSDAFLRPSYDGDTESDQNHNQIVTLNRATFLNNNVTSVFLKQNYVSKDSLPFSASAVALGGSL
jgi:hypothetical protein